MKISTADAKEILALERSDINMTLLKKYFAVTGKAEKPRFNSNDTLVLPKTHFLNTSKEDFETTVGRYIYNLVVLPKEYLDKYGYLNEPVTLGTVNDIEEKLGSMLLYDQIEPKVYVGYLDRGEWLAMGTAYFMNPSVNFSFNRPIPEVIKRRDELFEKNAEALKKGDSNVAAVVEKELISMARDILTKRGDPTYDFFASDALKKGAFENNYKKTSIMNGIIQNPYSKKLDVIKSNFIDGLQRTEVGKFSNLTITGGYSSGIETQKSGYETKKINNALQTVVLGEAGSDCGTKFYSEIDLDPSQASMFVNRYILDNGKLVLLTGDNIKSYIGKRVKMRSPLFCKSDQICNKCAGELFYRLGIRNAGLLTSTLSGSLMNAALKKKHDTTVKFTRINIEDFIVEEE